MSHKLTHIDESGNAVMVDVSDKKVAARLAVASGKVQFPESIFKTLSEQQFSGKKGSILQTAIIAGIQAVKKTSDLIPLCHQINLTKVHIDIVPGVNELQLTCTVKCSEKTGVEMEALTGVSIASLTVYDMCKALSPDIVITNVQLEKKTGGKNDFER